MQRRNPLLTIFASVAGIFLLVGFCFYHFSAILLTAHIKLKDFDTIMGVGIGVNLALGVLKGIRDGICAYFKLRFSGVKSNVVDKAQSLQQAGKITELQARDFESSTDNLSWSIENNKAHAVVQSFVVGMAIVVAVTYLIGLTLTAFDSTFGVYGIVGAILIVILLLPVGIFIFLISILAALPEHKLRKNLKTLNGLSEVITNGGALVKPISPTKS